MFAAVHLDGGITAVSELIHRVLLDVEREEVVEERRRDYKTLLQEHIQRKAGQELTYCMVREEGPDHAKTFVTEVQLNGTPIGEGSGHSKKESEQTGRQSRAGNAGREIIHTACRRPRSCLRGLLYRETVKKTKRTAKYCHIYNNNSAIVKPEKVCHGQQKWRK